MKFIELFAGIGGFRIGLEKSGHECVWSNEIDKHAVKIYNKNFGEKNEPTDIRTVKAEDIPDHDILCGGFPCQSFSIAGKRKGFEDTRGTLFFEICRIAKAKRSKYLFLENVKGLLNHDEGRTFRTILKHLDEMGYDAEWQCCNSKHFGVAQNRERVFIIGFLRGSGRRKIFPVRQDDKKAAEIQEQCTDTITERYNEAQGNGPYIIECKKPPQMLTERRTEESKKIRKKSMKKGVDWSPRRGKELVPRTDDLSNCITSAQTKEQLVIVHCTQTRSPDRPSIKKNPKAGGSGHLSRNDGITYCIDTGNTQAIEIKDVLLGHSRDKKGNTTYHEVDIAGTVKPPTGNQCNYLIQGTRIRRLTPKECYRLQGFCQRHHDGSFDDGFYNKAKEATSNRQIYKTAGNAVTVNVIYAIAKVFSDIYDA